MTISDPSASLSTFRFRKRTPGTFALVPFPRQGRSIRCQGQLEAAAAQILSACPKIRDVQEQPVTIWYSWDGTQVTLLDGPPTKALRRLHHCSYIVPDFLVTMLDGAHRLVEVKPSSKLERPIVQRKFTVGRMFAQQQGWNYYVVTERELFRGPLLANVRLLNRFRCLVVDSAELGLLKSAVSERPLALGDAMQRFGNDRFVSDVKAALLHLVATGQLDIDPLDVAISDSIILYPGGTISWDPFDSVWGPSGSSTVGSSASSDNLVPINSSPKT